MTHICVTRYQYIKCLIGLWSCYPKPYAKAPLIYTLFLHTSGWTLAKLHWNFETWGIPTKVKLKYREISFECNSFFSCSIILRYHHKYGSDTAPSNIKNDLTTELCAMHECDFLRFEFMTSFGCKSLLEYCKTRWKDVNVAFTSDVGFFSTRNNSHKQCC